MALRALDRAAGGLARLCAALSGAAVLALATLLFVDVLARAFGHPLFGAQDIAEMGMILATFGAVALLDRRGEQIRVELLASRLPAAVRRWGDRLSALLGAAIYATLAVTLWRAAELSSLLSLSSNILGLPKAPFQILLAALALVAALNAGLRGLLPAKEPAA